MQQSEQINALAAALAKAQGAMRSAHKDSVNPHFKSRYADLSSVWDACRDALTSNGLSVVQAAISDMEQASVGVTTRLMHSSGQWIEETLWTRPRDLSPQSVGSALTYLRRYGLAAAVGVVADDDDGEAAQPEKPQNRPQSSRPAQAPRPAPKPQPAASGAQGVLSEDHVELIAEMKQTAKGLGWKLPEWQKFVTAGLELESYYEGCLESASLAQLNTLLSRLVDLKSAQGAA